MGTSKILPRIMVLLTAFSLSAQAHLTPEQQAAKETGLQLYNQYQADAAIGYLESAAWSGDAEAQYFLAEALRRNSRYMTQKAHDWYMVAAQQGNLSAMLRLTRIDKDFCTVLKNCPVSDIAYWIEQFKQAASERLKRQDPEAARLLYSFTSDVAWLKLAAEYGDAKSQYLLSRYYLDKNPCLPDSAPLTHIVERLLQASAEQGYSRAMMAYGWVRYFRYQNEAEYLNWMRKAAETGDIQALYDYALLVRNANHTFSWKPDLVTSYSLLSLIAALNSGGTPDFARRDLNELEQQMSEEQILESQALAAQWADSHPPLSYFPSRTRF